MAIGRLDAEVKLLGKKGGKRLLRNRDHKVRIDDCVMHSEYLP